MGVLADYRAKHRPVSLAACPNVLAAMATA
jgi:hypothetical protein